MDPKQVYERDKDYYKLSDDNNPQIGDYVKFHYPGSGINDNDEDFGYGIYYGKFVGKKILNHREFLVVEGINIRRGKVVANRAMHFMTFNGTRMYIRPAQIII